MENMHIAMDEAAKKVRREIMDDAKKAWAKEDYLAEEKEQEARVRLFEQQKEMEKKFKDKMARKDNKMKESDIDEALEKVPRKGPRVPARSPASALDRVYAETIDEAWLPLPAQVLKLWKRSPRWRHVHSNDETTGPGSVARGCLRQ